MTQLELADGRPIHITRDSPTGLGIGYIMTRAEAEELIERARGKTPADWLSWTHIGQALHIIGDSVGGLRCARKAMELYPCSYTLLNTAVILECFGEFDEALELAANAVVMDPTNQFVGLLWAQGHLRRGNWAGAWASFEHYCWGRIWEVGLEQYIPQWQGESLTGKKILILQGGGFGDNLMFMRWFQDLKEMGAHITYACPDVMVPLLEGHPWIDKLMPTHEGPDTDELPELDIDVTKDGVKQFDYFAPIMGLPKRLGVTVESLRWDGPYIKSNRAQRVHRYHANGTPVVGICWAGAEKLDPRRHRSLTVEQRDRLLAIKSVTWVNLQYGTAVRGIQNPYIGNWADTAAIVDGLDFVVTVDTGVMHLAGAMGKRTIALIPSLSDWKFGLWKNNGNRMHFYPSVQLVRNGEFAKEPGLDYAVNWLVSELPRLAHVPSRIGGF
jgi:hypothetical protein